MLNQERLTLYVDVENLMDLAKEAIAAAFEQWPEEFPRPSVLKLYARADQVELWRVWATHKFPSLEVHVTGVQHYSVSASKNSADIALALDAMADLLKGRTTYVAVLSDDSDFAVLFGKISQEFPRRDDSAVPFIWFMTDRLDTRSSILNEFFPSRYVRTVACDTRKPAPQHRIRRVSPAAAVQKSESDTAEARLIADTIIKNIPIGSFKSTDCVRIIRQHFPDHPLTKLDPAKFGTRFTKSIWPILESYGVRLTNPNKKPRRYEMTEEAKSKIEATPTEAHPDTVAGWAQTHH
ncbi:MAG: NYN domain-containing protein [Chloroflexi bacterium]|nr:NYN domain-containing protein [Chloroflexota bacterium]